MQSKKLTWITKKYFKKEMLAKEGKDILTHLIPLVFLYPLNTLEN